jgi:catechol 2,3-dioxygenase-like lactoylglutathione lyase family enzyme
VQQAGWQLGLALAREWDTGAMAIIGVHAILYTRDAEADRAWFARVLGLDSVDAGGGWIIFALPPTELAAHPASREGGDVELYMMCDSIETTMGELRDKGVVFDGSVTDQRWGLVTKIVLPSGARLGLYEPRHASPLLPAD